MKKTLIALAACCLAVVGTAQDNLSALMPMPNHVELPKGRPLQIVEGRTAVACPPDSLLFVAETVSDILTHRTGLSVPVAAPGKGGAIVLSIDPTLEGAEHYRIEASRRGIVLSGSTAAALYRGAMTLDQLLLGDVVATRKGEVMPVVIDDAPRFGHRALMLDPARHFLPVEDVKFFIDQMAKYKYNVLQLHLTDDQGWRVAINSHPRLASREHYTQDDLRHIIDYAAQRHIEVIPEMDIPGHTVAILAAYPELACSHLETDTVVVGHTTNRMVCAAKEKSYQVLTDVIGELAELFPSSYLHLGGDEAAVPANWAQCAHCRAMMDEAGYTEATQLMTPFFDRILEAVRAHGKKPILWCELDNIYPPANDYLFPYPEDVTLVTWRYGLTPTCQTLTLQHGHPIIMAPGEYAYLDYPQWKGDLPEYNNWGMPLSTLENCYRLDPGYGRPAAEQRHVLGVMGTLWAEAINDVNRATYMAFPRAFALAEAGWTNMEHRDWQSFKTRMYPNLSDLMQSGVSVRVPFEVAKHR
ncbi:MAG: beta-N-acetylhexosaminidase [Bacteroidaceae bacterium]|nr:beta-N-acetylhexosaminidase [Bacteroidaceae bacterium]